MTAVLLVRHPQTTWNVEGRYQGTLNAPLSPQGEEQAERAASVFAGCDIAAVYSSPLGRATHLAERITAVTGAGLRIDERLAEIGLGEWQGLYRDQIEERFAPMYKLWYTRPDEVHFPGGEMVEDVRRRATAWLADVFAAHSGNLTVVAVSHSAVIQVLSACALGLDLAHLHRIRISNCSITTLGGCAVPGLLLTLNDVSALYTSPVAAASHANFVSWMARRTTN